MVSTVLRKPYKKTDITIRFVPNLLEDKDRELKSFIYNRDKTILEYLRDSGFDFKDMRVSVNGHKAEDLNRRLTIGDEITIYPSIELPAGFLGLGTFWINTINIAAFVVSVGYSIYSAVAAKSIKMPTFDTSGGGMDEGSAASTWDGARTTALVGKPIPVVYGERVLGGNVLNEYVSTDGSKNYLHTLLGVGWGEMESIALRRIDRNTATNYPGWALTTRMGTLNQAVIPNFHDSHNLISVNVQLTQGNAYTYTTDGSDVEAFEVHLTVPGLYQQDAQGNFLSWDIIYQVEYRLHSGGEWTVLDESKISKCTRNSFKVVYRKDGLTAGQYEVRITRISADPSDLSFPITSGDFWFERIDEISCEDEQIFPRVALAAINALALDQLSGAFPDYELLVKGRKVMTPAVMNDATLVPWDDYYWDPDDECYKLLEDDTELTLATDTAGNVIFVTAYSANPIWCIYDIQVNRLFGAGHYITAADNDVDYLLEQSQYCEEKVSDGNGGYEKRFRMDVVIDSQQKALDLILQMGTICRAHSFYSDKGQVKIVVEKPEVSVQLFSPGNTITDSFSSNWGSRRDIPNLVNVQFDDENNNYTPQTVQAYVDDAALTVGQPLNPVTIRYPGVKESYAIRFGRDYFKALKYIANSMKISSALGAMIRTCGEVIDIAHDVPQFGFGGTVQGARYKGNYAADITYAVNEAVTYSGVEYRCILLSLNHVPTNATYWEIISQTKIKIDRTVVIESGKSYAIRVDFARGGYEERTVTDAAGSYTELNVSEAFSKTPFYYDIYSFGEVDKVVKPGRIMGITRSRSGEIEFDVPEYNANIFDDSAVVLPQKNPSALSTDFPDVTDLTLTETTITKNDGTIENAIVVSFSKPDLTTYIYNTYKKAKIYYSDNDGVNWIYAGETSGTEFVISNNIQVGLEYTIAVVSVGISDRENDIDGSPQDTITLEGKTNPPATVANFAYTFTKGIVLKWDKNVVADLAGYEIRDEDDNWNTEDSHRIYLGFANTFEITSPASRAPGTYYIKAFDTSGNYSTTAASVTPTNAAPAAPSLVATQWFGFAKIEWTNINDVDLKLYQVYKSATNAWAGEEVLESEVSGRAVNVQGHDPVDVVAALITGSSPSATSIIDASLINKGVDYFVGDRLLQTSGTYAGQEATITAFNNTTGQVSVASWPSGTPSALDKFTIKDRAYYKVRAVDAYGPGTFSAAVTIDFTPLTESQLGDAIISARKLITGELITLSAQIKDLIVTNAKISDLDGGKITAESITLSKLSADAVPPKTFYQDTEPATGMNEGDYWIDTDDSNKLYVYQDSDWTVISQSGGSGGITVFRQSSCPTALAAGDLWIDSDDSKLYRATAAGDDAVTAGEWILVDVALATGWAHASDTTKIDGGDIYTGSITADKITTTQLDAIAANTGTLTVDETLTVGDGSIVIDGPNNCINVYDDAETPVLRVKIGQLS